MGIDIYTANLDFKDHATSLIHHLKTQINVQCNKDTGIELDNRKDSEVGACLLRRKGQKLQII
jgi:hypothetical protein